MDTVSVLWWSIVLVGLVVAGFIAVAQVKKRLVRNGDVEGPGFTLADLRALHRSGKLTDEEFERAKLAVVASSRPLVKPPITPESNTPPETDPNDC